MRIARRLCTRAAALAGATLLVAWVALAGCTPAADTVAPRVDPGPPQRAAGGLSPIDPGTSYSALLSAGACVTCHVAEHAEWAGSRHGKAWTNRIFQREYREQPSKWCVHCHAPLGAQVDQVWPLDRDNGHSPLADEGVGCAACHVREGRIVARTQRPGSPHDTREWAAFGSPSFCAGCHQFEFPVIEDDGQVLRLSPHPMQKTVAEFNSGPWAAEVEDGCRTCHAATGARHSYPGAHSPSMLERALSLTACREDDATLVLWLANVGAGHAVPTGDLHRHLALRAWRPSAPHLLFDAFIGRRFEPADDGGKKTTWDSSLKPRERRRYRVPLVKLGGAADEVVEVELRYVYVSDEQAAHPSASLGDELHFRVVDAMHLDPRELPMCAVTARPGR